MFKFISAAVIFLTLSTQAMAWELKEMNRHINETNFIVDSGCSGTLISTVERLILTNYHCVQRMIKTDPKNPDVLKLSDVRVHQKEYDGHEIISAKTHITTIEAHDKNLDLALLKFKSKEIPFSYSAKIVDRKAIRGESVWMVGNPFGMESSVARGIISSTNRMVTIFGIEYPYIQTDAGITGGNSGGALYDDEGFFIGVPAAAVRGTVLGLAIPSTFVVGFLDDNCWSSVYDDEADSHSDCIKNKEE